MDDDDSTQTEKARFLRTPAPTIRFWRKWTALSLKFGRPPSQKQYVPQLDGLRCLAILIVLIWHSSLRFSRFTDRLHSRGVRVKRFHPLFVHGEVGVNLFFVISGLVIAQSFLSEPQGSSTRVFYVRRFLRIYPPYIVVLITCYLLLAVSKHAPEGAQSFVNDGISLSQSFGASALYLHSVIFDAPSRLNPPMWSLEIEILFYLTAPILLRMYQVPTRRSARLTGLIGVVLVCVGLTAWSHTIWLFDNRYRAGLLVYLPLLLCGIAIADLSMPGAMLSHVEPSVKYDAALLAGFGMLCGLGLWMTRVDAHPKGFVPNLLAPLGGIAVSVLLYLGATNGRVGRVIFGHPAVTLIGTMCYSIYLTHVLVLQVLSEVFLYRLTIHNSWLVYGVWSTMAIPMVLASGFAFYLVVERPTMVRAQMVLK